MAIVERAEISIRGDEQRRLLGQHCRAMTAVYGRACSWVRVGVEGNWEGAVQCSGWQLPVHKIAHALRGSHARSCLPALARPSPLPATRPGPSGFACVCELSYTVAHGEFTTTPLCQKTSHQRASGHSPRPPAATSCLPRAAGGDAAQEGRFGSLRV